MSGTGIDYIQTPNLGLYKPIYDHDVEMWGTHLNANSDVLDAALATSGTGALFLPLAGGQMQGALTLAANATSSLQPVTLQQMNAAVGTGGPYLSLANGGTVTGATTFTGSLNIIPTGGTATRSVQNLTGDILNVKDFGAKGDNTTDDTAAIQAAVNHGGAIRFPAGRYLISAAITSPTTTPITLLGDGLNSSIIIQTTAAANGFNHTSAQSFQMFGMGLMCNGIGGTALNLNFGAGTVSWLTLRDIYIVGNGNQTTNFWHDGIICNQPSGTTIDHVSIIGTNQGSLSNIGNAIYFTPISTGSFVVLISNTMLNYYQSGVVFNSTGASTNLQGLVLDWVNCNLCMQFVTVLGTCLELVLHKCQYEGFGSAIHAEGGNTVTVRDCLFFVAVSATMAIAAQIPQDVIYASAGGNWWIADNAIVLQANAVATYIMNFLGSFNGARIRDNNVYVGTSATATGLINIASGTANIDESGTTTSFWNSAWPLTTNANATGGIRNSTVFRGIGTANVLTADTWQQQGSYLGWNYSASAGETDFICSRGGGTGGFNFYNAPSTPGSTPALIGQITPTGLNTTPIGATTTATGAFTNLSATGLTTGSTAALTVSPNNSSVTAIQISGTTGAGISVNDTSPNGVIVTGTHSTHSIWVLDSATQALRVDGTHTNVVDVTGGTVTGIAWNGLCSATWLSSRNPLTGTQWQNQGTYFGWNQVGGSGATDILCSHGGGAGGFNFFNTASSSGSTPTLLASVDSLGDLMITGGLATSAPVTATGTTYNVTSNIYSMIINPTGTYTLTLPAAATYTGKIIKLKLIAAFAVNSATANVVPLAGGAATTAIMPATAGKYCTLISDGTNWQIMEAN